FRIGELQARLTVSRLYGENRGQDLPGSLIFAQACLGSGQVDLEFRIGGVHRQQMRENGARLEGIIRAEKGMPQTLQRVGVLRGFRQEILVQALRLFMVAAQAKRPCQTELEVTVTGVKFQGLLIGLDRGREVPAPQGGDSRLFKGRDICRERAPGFGEGGMGGLALRLSRGEPRLSGRERGLSTETHGARLKQDYR